MLDQLIIDSTASVEDFDASVKERKISAPKKKSIKETVPFSNVTYDFTAINGEIYWDERELEYIFEIIANTPEELEEKKTAFSSWIMNVANSKIYDPIDTDYHYIGTFNDISYEDEENLDKTTITVKFLAYPYKISNAPTVYNLTVSANAQYAKTVINSSSHRITPTISTNVAVTLQLDNVSYSVPAGETQNSTLHLKSGANTLIIQNNTNTSCTVVLSFYEEVF
jgi:hypothetical protein